MTSRFLKKVAQTAAPLVAPVSRFLSRHAPAVALAKAGRGINRIVRRIPIATKFMAFFVPDELRLDPPEVEPAPAQEAHQHIAPVYNFRARRPKGPTLG